jgi:hypothetical protein
MELAIKRILLEPQGQTVGWLYEYSLSNLTQPRRRGKRPENELESPVKMKGINKPRTTGEKRHRKRVFCGTKRSFLQMKRFPGASTRPWPEAQNRFLFFRVHYCVATGPVATATFSPKGS